ncbi:glycerol-3-phosphate 1-O-acyltransferase PlsY [Polycyclovorans algicola]|uniref:glycerol-3-phosphate 1-O-acyltransferase PlsY n=1 Tax=Polycyclovorans algicola TaxID=616992 RepID=UPI000A6186E4|nr:glycerol-3-phosphate 1-O-acyltransferase PlsY [Polycyclovorans algicola]
MLTLTGLWAVGVTALLAYAVGLVMGGMVMTAIKGGADLRSTGSGNVGATNALRTRGKGFAAGVLAIDVAKGVIAVWVLPPLLTADPTLRAMLGFVAGAAVTVGHCYPLIYRFKGGKGVATLAGVFAVLLPGALPLMLGGFVLVVILSGYVSLATLMASALALLHVACFGVDGLWSLPGAFVTAMVALVVWKHRSNIANLIAGREHRFDKARLLHQWLRRP